MEGKASFGLLSLESTMQATDLRVHAVQDMASWMRDGIAGLQSVVLYSLPELDGAIDTIPLGGLVGDSIYLIPERCHRLARRIRQWTRLRRTPAKVSLCEMPCLYSYKKQCQEENDRRSR